MSLQDEFHKKMIEILSSKACLDHECPEQFADPAFPSCDACEVDFLLTLRYKDHRLAIVKGEGERPENPYVGDARHGFDKGQQSVFDANYVQEVKE